MRSLGPKLVLWALGALCLKDQVWEMSKEREMGETAETILMGLLV